MNNPEEPSPPRQKTDNEEGSEDDGTVHDFNISSNITVLENKETKCEGSDSGVDVEACTLKRTSSSASTTSTQEFVTVTPAGSYESSIVSCCSNYEEAYDILTRRNSSLLDDYKLRSGGDGNSEGGSESSSMAGSSSSLTKRNTKKKQVDLKTPLSSQRRPRLPVVPRNTSLSSATRSKSVEKSQKNKQELKTPRRKPGTLQLPTKKEAKQASSSRTSSTTRTPITTPTDDGRWPSINSKPAPLMARSFRGLGDTPKQLPQEKIVSLQKYATLPRRRKEKSVDSIQDLQKPGKPAKPTPPPPAKKPANLMSLPPYPRKKTKTKIYHETSVQTALTRSDIEKVLSGVSCHPARPQDKEMSEKEVQADADVDEIAKLKGQLKALLDKYEAMSGDHKQQTDKLTEYEVRLQEEQTEKEGLKEELRQNSERVLAILGNNDSLPDGENSTTDSLLVLENQYQKVGKIVIKQENEISELNAYCRSLQRDLEKSVAGQKALMQQQLDLEAEGVELQEFMQTEKHMLNEALKEAENEIKKLNLSLAQKGKDVETKQDESKRLVRLSEQRRQENMGLQARLAAFEARAQELLVYQGSHISGAAVALSSLITRLDRLVDELVASYNISEQELEDVVFHNEAYINSSSSPDATPDNVIKKTFKSPSPKRSSSFVLAIINAIKNAATQASFAGSKDISKDTLSLDNSDSAEMLDSETEPCLMMEPVLEDVVIPDGHSHNMISSGHGNLGCRLTRSESLTNLSQAIFQRQLSEHDSLNASYNSEMMPSLTELCPPVALVDQVIEVDNLVTRLLKVLRIIQFENDDCLVELQDERDHLADQAAKQKEANKVVAKQLKDWEDLGAHLKSEVTELMQQLNKKNKEIDDFKSELNLHKKEIERLNEDVCELSTACSKSELELKLKQDEVTDSIKKWEETGEPPSAEVLSRLAEIQNEVPILEEKLMEKEKELTELRQEFLDSRQVLSENWKEAIAETKKQYEAIDSALEILHSIQTVVQQCPPLAKLQKDLEETSFQMASSMPVVKPTDCNANGSLMKSVNGLEIPPPINSTA